MAILALGFYILFNCFRKFYKVQFISLHSSWYYTIVLEDLIYLFINLYHDMYCSIILQRESIVNGNCLIFLMTSGFLHLNLTY